jgi:hypothetical protein
MILFIRENSVLALCVFIICFITLFFGAFIQEQPSFVEQSFGPLLDLVYYIFFDVFSFKPWFVNIIQFSLLLVQASILNHIFKSQFINQQHWLTFIVFFLFTLIFQIPSLDLGWYIANTLLVFIVNTLINVSQKQKPLKEIFDVFFLMGLLLLLVPSSILFFVFIWVVMARFRAFLVTEVFIGIIGFFLPLIWFFSFLFLTNDSTYHWSITEEIFNSAIHTSPNMGYDDWMFLLIITLILIVVIVNIQASFLRITVKNRNYFVLHFWMLLFCVLSYILMPEKDKVGLLLMAIPLSSLFSRYLLILKRRLVSDLILCLLLFIALERQFNFI